MLSWDIFGCIKKRGFSMKRWRPKTPLGINVKYFVKWTIISALVGMAGGLAGSLFSLAVTWVTGLRGEYPWLLFFLPAAGLMIVGLYRLFHEEGNRGTNMVIDSISSNEEVTPATGPLIFVSTVLSHLTGASVGREGAALQLGGSIGGVIGKVIDLDEKDRKVCIMCGMSAVFSALFGTPVAAAIFSLEVVSIGVLYYAALVPCLFASFISLTVAQAFDIPPESYPVPVVPQGDLQAMVFVIFLAVLCALVSILFCLILHRTERLYKKVLPNPAIRILAGSLLFILLTLISGTRDYTGSGLVLIERAMEGQVTGYAFLLKMIFTAVALGAGFKGGEIVPTLCVGACFGCAVGTLFGMDPAFSTACGMASLFVGVTNCPISSLIIALELFGFAGMRYYAAAVAIAFTLSGYYGLYASQKFVYSKVKTEYINRRPTE